MGGRRRCAQLLCSAVPWLLLLQAQASLLPYSPAHQGECQDPNNEYYDETIHRCCSVCPPGFRVHQYCDESVDTQCEACEEGTYTNTSNSAPLCLGCNSKCRKGWVETQQCSRTQNRRCWCPANEFCRSMVSETCAQCQRYQQCPKGFGVAKPGTEKSNVECAPCKLGTFSDVVSHIATCRPHRMCEFVLLPGNRTNDAVCKNSSQPGIPPVTSPHPMVKGRETSSPELLVTTSPHVDVDGVQSKPPTDIAYIIGGLVTGLFIMVGFIVAVSCIISQRKALPCKQLFAGEKQPFSSTRKGPDKWPRVSGTARQEEEDLLKISPSSSGSLDQSPASDKSSGVRDLEDSKTEVEESQQRSSPLDSCVYHSKQTGPGGTHVNISCMVSICDPGHSLKLLMLNSLPDADAVVGEDVPLSKEESPIQRASERQTAVEVEEDNMDTLAYEEGKPLPLSVQDVGMKTR